MNDVKKTNLFYLILIVLYLAVSMILSLATSRNVSMGIIGTLILSEMLFLVPAFIFLLIGRKNITEWVPFRKIKWSTVGLTILFTMCIAPIATLLNILSQLFVTNAVAEIAEDILALPMFLSIFLIGIFGPFCEEFVFRGIIYTGLKKSGSILCAGLISGLFFGLAHMNLNQFSYAFLLGIAFALLTEATGSIIPSLISHAIINSSNVLLEYAINLSYSLVGGDYSDIINQSEESLMTKDQLLIISGVYLVPASIGALLCVILLRAIARREGKLEHMSDIIHAPKKNVLTISGVLAIILCLFIIFVLDKLI